MSLLGNKSIKLPSSIKIDHLEKAYLRLSGPLGVVDHHLNPFFEIDFQPNKGLHIKPKNTTYTKEIKRLWVNCNVDMDLQCKMGGRMLDC